DVKDHDQVLLLWKNGVMGDEYFLVENRQRTGWDSALPAGGLLIYHCDDAVTTQNDRQWWWTGSEGSTRGGHYVVALEQADGLFNLERVGTGSSNSGDAGDPFVAGTEF